MSNLGSQPSFMTFMTLLLWGSRFQVPSDEFINELLGYNLSASWRYRSSIFQCFVSFTYLYVIFAKCSHLCYLRLPLPLWSRKVGNNCLLFFLSSPEIHTWVPRNLCPSLSSSFFLVPSSQFQFKSILRQNSLFLCDWNQMSD